MTDSKLYIEAMKVDILTILESPNIGVFELRKIQNITKAMVDFVNSMGTYSEREGFMNAMAETSDGVSPMLHTTLMNRAFDGQEALRELAIGLMDKYADLKGAAADVQDLHQSLVADSTAAGRRQHLAGELGLGDTLNKVRQLGAGGDVKAEPPEDETSDDKDDKDGEYIPT